MADKNSDTLVSSTWEYQGLIHFTLVTTFGETLGKIGLLFIATSGHTVAITSDRFQKENFICNQKNVCAKRSCKWGLSRRALLQFTNAKQLFVVERKKCEERFSESECKLSFAALLCRYYGSCPNVIWPTTIWPNVIWQTYSYPMKFGKPTVIQWNLANPQLTNAWLEMSMRHWSINNLHSHGVILPWDSIWGL